jgi:hypothetical protein
MCGQNKQDFEFHKNKQSIDDLHGHCKSCRSIYLKQRRVNKVKNVADIPNQFNKQKHAQNKKISVCGWGCYL